MARPRKSGTVAVEGLKELQRELKKLGEPELVDGLKDANLEVGVLVVNAAQSGASGRLQKAAARSLKASRQAARAQVVGGTGRVDFFGGAEFGSGQNIPRVSESGRAFLGYNQFEPFRGSGNNAGYFLYPAIRSSTDEIVEVYGDAIDRLTRAAFPT